MCEKTVTEKVDLQSLKTLLHDDVANDDAQADEPRMSDSDVPPKKRKTRRGKSKRKNLHPYRKDITMIKPEAPYNSNRFLIEDHGDLDEIDEELKKNDQASASTVTRTRDSSVSVDSDAEFYSTPDDEEVFLIKDFDSQYEKLQAERFQNMVKDELIQEFLQLEKRVEILTKRLRSRNEFSDKSDVHKEIQRLTLENENLKRENESLRTKLTCSSDSADSETDSNDSCSSSSSSDSRHDSSVDYKFTNGHPESESN